MATHFLTFRTTLTLKVLCFSVEKELILQISVLWIQRHQICEFYSMLCLFLKSHIIRTASNALIWKKLEDLVFWYCNWILLVCTVFEGNKFFKILVWIWIGAFLDAPIFKLICTTFWWCIRSRISCYPPKTLKRIHSQM